MARQFDPDKKLSADDIAYLKARHPLSYVERMIELHGAKKGADSEDAVAKAAAEVAEEAEKAALQAEREADEATAVEAAAEAEKAAQEAEEDLIGDGNDDPDAGNGGGETFDVLSKTEAEVKNWAAKASDEDKAAALAVENGRDDRDPRKGVVSILS